MNPRLFALAIVPFLLHLHLGVSVAGSVVTVSLPWVIPVVLVAAVLVLSWLIWRQLRTFRSSPFPRTVST